MLTIFLSPSLIEQERHPLVTFSVPLHPYNADLVKCPRTVQGTTRFSTQEWFPALAADGHSHYTNMQNTLGYKNILGLVGSTLSLEEHLASWTKGGEGQKGSGE